MPKPALSQQDLDEHLFASCATGNISHATLAIHAGANVNAHSKAHTTGQTTPLHIAARLEPDRGGIGITKLLIDNDADVSAKNGKGLTPTDIARNNGSPTIAELLSNAAKEQESHASRVTEERKGKGPPQVGG